MDSRFIGLVLELEQARGRASAPRVQRVVAAVDCGLVINPRIATQQVESAVLFGLSAALYGRIDIEAGAVRQSNFHDYRQLRLAETPVIETVFIASTRDPAGLGEPGTPPVAPALANAWFALTGQRQRELPLRLTLGAAESR